MTDPTERPQRETPIPPAFENVEQALEMWAQAVRLPAAELDAMQHRIMAEPRASTARATAAPRGDATPSGALPATWWRDLARHVTDVIVQVNRPPVVPGFTWST
ncbi:MAG TPA: hypothetical protein VIL34_14190 [Actinopolymorphaceae bacterium]|jgi:Tfp pilus assembly protein FimV